MIYEWRIYTVMPGKMSTLNRSAEKAMKLMEKYGIKVVGFWEAEVGPSNTLYYMLAYESMAHREKAWNAYMVDPEGVKMRQGAEKEGAVVERTINLLLKPTSYSPMQ